MATLKEDPSYNLARRYRRLFRLPSLPLGVALVSIITIGVELIARGIHQESISSKVAYALLTELLLLASIELDRLVLKGQSGIGTFRRLTAIAIMSNLVWFATGILALIVLIVSGSEDKFIALIIAGLVFAISFRAFIFGAAFYGSTFQGLPLSFALPILLSLPILFLPSASHISVGLIIKSVISGVLYLAAIEAYLYFVNKRPLVDRYNPLQLLQAFLDAWTLEDASRLEAILDSVSEQNTVSTEMLSIHVKNGKSALIVVPGIHPGPFYPVGSSNLPADVYSELKANSMFPMTVHSISDHELNLPSATEVKKYTSSLKKPLSVDHGRLMTIPVTKHRGKATVTGIAFGTTCLISLTQAPHGMEDVPMRVRREIEDRARGYGFKLTLVVDTHNSDGAKPNHYECDDLIRCAGEVLQNLSTESKSEFRIGLAHSSELKGQLQADIGPAGFGLIVFETISDRFCLVIVDANNAKLGFREDVFRNFEERTYVKIIELCTSDTHVTAAKTRKAKGYLALGDITPVEMFVSDLSSLYALAQDRIAEGFYSSESVESEVKTIGGQILNDFSVLADKTSNTAKRGAKILAILGTMLVLAAII